MKRKGNSSSSGRTDFKEVNERLQRVAFTELDWQNSRLSYWSERIAAEKKAYQKGDKVALFAAIRLCANYEQVLPGWVARGFINGYDAILNCRSGSWDEAFGSPFPNGAKLNARRKKRLGASKAWLEVRAARRRGEPIGQPLFETLGKKMGISGSTFRDWYYEQEKIHRFTTTPTPPMKRKITQPRAKQM